MIKLSTRRVLAAFTGLLVAIFVVHLGLQLLVAAGLLDDDRWLVHAFLQLIHVDVEQNLTTFLACFLLTAAGLLALWLQRLERLPWPGWGLLALVFLAAALDEFVGVHEALIPVVGGLLDAGGIDTGGWLRFAWVVPGAIVSAAIAAAFLRPLLTLAEATRNGLVLGAGLFLFGALGLELPGGRIADAYGNEGVPFLLVTTMEEGLEFAGVLVWLRTLVRHLRLVSATPTLQLVVTPATDVGAQPSRAPGVRGRRLRR